MGEWSAKYGSSATRQKVYLGKITNWFARLNVAEIQVEATPLHQGDELLFIGPTTGAMEMTVEDLRVDYLPAREAPQGIRCSVAVPSAAQEGNHPRRGDKVYIWRKI